MSNEEWQVEVFWVKKPNLKPQLFIFSSKEDADEFAYTQQESPLHYCRVNKIEAKDER